MAAAHEVNAPYYSGFTVGSAAAGVPGGAAAIPQNGGPSSTWGWVVGAGLRLNFPMIAQGDYFQSQVNYTQGAPRYVDFTDNVPTLGYIVGNGMAYGLMSDCVYGQNEFTAAGSVVGGTGCNLTTAWGVNAGYEHYWTPQFHESFVFNYLSVSYNGQSNAILCTLEGFGAGPGHGTTTAFLGSSAVAEGGCNNNWNIWTGATRFQYDVTKSFYLGVEFLYQRYDSMSSPTGVIGPTIANNFQTTATSAGVTQFTPLKDENNLAITVRAHKDFLP
jgi:Porin subfamily